jgi:hypothetical protein
MLGLAAQRTSSPAEAPGFVDQTPEEYRGQERLLLGLLLQAELSKLGFAPNERKEVRDTLAKLVEGDRLSNRGVARLNEYASGGFDLLQQEIGDKPYNVEAFLPRYVGLLQRTVDGEATWNPAA